MPIFIAEHWAVHAKTLEVVRTKSYRPLYRRDMDDAVMEMAEDFLRCGCLVELGRMSNNTLLVTRIAGDLVQLSLWVVWELKGFELDGPPTFIASETGSEAVRSQEEALFGAQGASDSALRLSTGVRGSA